MCYLVEEDSLAGPLAAVPDCNPIFEKRGPKMNKETARIARNEVGRLLYPSESFQGHYLFLRPREQWSDLFRAMYNGRCMGMTTTIRNAGITPTSDSRDRKVESILMQ